MIQYLHAYMIDMLIIHEQTNGNMLMIMCLQYKCVEVLSQHMSIVRAMPNTANIYHLVMKTCKASWVPNFENAQVTSLLLGPNRWHHLSVSNYFSPPFWDKAFTFRLYPTNDHLNHVLILLNIIKYHCVTLFFQRHAHLPIIIKNISKSISKNIMKPCNIP